MRAACILSLCLITATGWAADTSERQRPLLNVEVVDSHGVTTTLAGFHRLSGEDFFRGYLGAGSIEVPYDRVRTVRVAKAATPGGRMRARFLLRSGKEVAAEFDEREGEQLFTGFAYFGRVSYYFRDLRSVRIVGPTSRGDLPSFGAPAPGVDVRLSDREGVTTELVAFRRLAIENIVPGLRGSGSIEIPLRIVQRLRFSTAGAAARLLGQAELRGGKSVEFRLPTFEEDTVYRGAAEFGAYRIRLRAVRELIVHRPTPALRRLDPLAAAEGREQPEGEPRR